jgi:hypothetical protein
MQLHGLGGRTARLDVSCGGAWEVLSGSMYSVMNALSLTV